MTTRRQFLAACGIASAAALLAPACARKRQLTENGKTLLEYYTYATPEFLRLYNQRLIPAFEAKFPHIKVRMNTNLGNAGYDSKLLTLMAAGIAPDVFHVTQQNFPFYAARDVLLPIDPFVAEDRAFHVADFYPQVLAGMRAGGKLLGLPGDCSPSIMFCNLDLFHAAKIPYPRQDWTWDEYLDISRRLTDPARRVYGTLNPYEYNRWPMWVWMNGGDVFNADASRCTMDTPAAIDGLRFYVDLSQKYHVAPSRSAQMGQEAQTLFASQRIAIAPNSRYVYKRYTKDGALAFRWDCATNPRGKSLASTLIWGGDCILASTPHPCESWEFLKFLTGPEGAAISLAAGNALPAHRPSAEAEVLHPTDPTVPRHDKYFLDAIEYARCAPFPADYASFNAAQGIIQDAFLGLDTVEGACRRFTNRVNDSILGEEF